MKMTLPERLREMSESSSQHPDDRRRWREAADRLISLEAALNGFFWLHNNMQNYGTDAWREFFESAVDDARRAKEART